MNGDDAILEIKNCFTHLTGELRGMMGKMNEATARQGKLEEENFQLRTALDSLRKAQLGGERGQRSVNRKAGHVVSAECAKHLAAIVILGADRNNKLKELPESDRSELVRTCSEIVGLEKKTALTTSDIPLPVGYASEVI